MRIGIYNRWLPTLGGGERYTLDFARVFAADGHEVELITHQPMELAAVQARLVLEQGRIAMRSVPDSPGNQRMAAVSADYDLLLNLSQGDLFPSRARRSALVVHFPAPLPAYTSAGVPTIAAGWIGSPSRVDWLAGTYPPESDGQRCWAWTGAHARIEIQRAWPLPARWLVLRQLELRPPSVPPPLVRVLANGACIAQRADAWTSWQVTLPTPVRRGEVLEVELEVEPWTLRAVGLAADDRERGVALGGAALIGAGIEQRWARQPWCGMQTTERSIAEVGLALDTYHCLLANSRFTQSWIERRWQRASEVLYPTIAVANDSLWAGHKAPLILSVGRFFAGAHNKQHLPMIAAFKSLCDEGLRGWEYHLVGGCDLDQPEQRDYLEHVQAAAAGYPITMHVNAPLATLQQLYGAASLFWHAAGFGVDEQHNPDAVEHFGITTIEAMAAGCVPVALAKGGQVETVELNRSGLLWHTLAELQAHTRLLINDEPLRQRLSAGARERSQLFSQDVFAARVRDVFG